jgi:hypothetical protein
MTVNSVLEKFFSYLKGAKKMSKKLLALIGGTLISGMLLVGCGANDDEQNPPPEDIDLNEDVNNGDRVDDDNLDLDMDENNDGTNGNNGTNGTNGTTGTDNGMNGTNGTGTNGTGTTGNGTNGTGTTGNGTNGTTGTNGDADLLDDNDDNN